MILINDGDNLNQYMVLQKTKLRQYELASISTSLIEDVKLKLVFPKAITNLWLF
jgi:hypothetical protein